jgi:hypothetical protein
VTPSLGHQSPPVTLQNTKKYDPYIYKIVYTPMINCANFSPRSETKNSRRHLIKFGRRTSGCVEEGPVEEAGAALARHVQRRDGVGRRPGADFMSQFWPKLK